MSRIAVESAIAFFLFIFCTSYAAGETWQAVGGSYGDNGKTIPLFGGYEFEDGQFTQRTPFDDPRPGAVPAYTSYGFVMFDKPLASQFDANVGFVFEKIDDRTRPPRVDMEKKTIDVSSLLLKGLARDPNSPRHDLFRPVGIGLAGTFDPVPFTENADGTFTAKWATPTIRGLSSFYGSNQPVSITFSAVGVVPEPTSFWLLVTGLGANGLMLWFIGRKKTRRVPRVVAPIEQRPAWYMVALDWLRGLARGGSLPSFPQHQAALIDNPAQREKR